MNQPCKEEGKELLEYCQFILLLIRPCRVPLKKAGWQGFSFLDVLVCLAAIMKFYRLGGLSHRNGLLS